MPITIDGDGTITGVSVGGLPDGIVDTDMIAAGAVTAAKRGTGAILQVVQASTSTEVEVNTQTFTDTGLSGSITPQSTSSKILVIIDQAFYGSRLTANHGMGLKVFRDSTEIHSPTANSIGPYEFYYAGVTGFYDRAVIHKLDSPATTSSVTYKTQGRPYEISSTGRIFYQVGGATNATSYITLIEVAG